MASKKSMMKRVLELAKKGKGQVSPNPMVGAVVVKDGQVIGKGYHRGQGKPHAEIEAIRNCKTDIKDAVLYVNLEPCSHYGTTPPCTEAIISAGISKLVCAMKDPNPLVKGDGIKTLESAGINVELGIKEKQARQLNEKFVRYITTGQPFTLLKMAMSLDGKIRHTGGQPVRFSSEESLVLAHELRKEYDAILVGIGTVLEDDPRLDVRLSEGERTEITRIILDGNLRIPLDAEIFKTLDKGDIYIITSPNTDPDKRKHLEERGVYIETMERDSSGFNLEEVKTLLGEKEIIGLIVEGGAKIARSLIKEKTADKVIICKAPIIMGEHKTLSAFNEIKFDTLEECPRLIDIDIRESGSDSVIQGYPEYKN